MSIERRDTSFATFASAWCRGFIAYKEGTRDDSREDLEAFEQRLMADYAQWCLPLGPPEIPDAMVERAAIGAFERDTLDGHHKGGPWTWDSIGEHGRCNYRLTVRAALEAAFKP